jgi:hypothetical protein
MDWIDEERRRRVQQRLDRERERRSARRRSGDVARQQFYDTLEEMARRIAAADDSAHPYPMRAKLHSFVDGHRIMEEVDDASPAEKLARLMILPMPEAERARLEEELDVWFCENGYIGD